MHIFELRRIQSVAYKRPEAAIKSPDSISTFWHIGKRVAESKWVDRFNGNFSILKNSLGTIKESFRILLNSYKLFGTCRILKIV